MFSPVLLKTLQILGLNENETKVYFGVLQLGSPIVQDIARVSEVNRATCYGVLNSLLLKGFVTERMQGSTKYYSAVPIELLFESFKHEVSKLETAIPLIQKLHPKDDHDPKVEFYKGTEGIVAMYEDSLTAQNEIATYVNPASLLNKAYEMSRYSMKPRRIAKGIKMRVIYPRNEAAFYSKSVLNSEKELKEIRFLPKDKFKINHEISIYDDKIAYVFFEENEYFGVTIKEKDLVETEKSIFEMMWDYCMNFDQTVPDDFDLERFIEKKIRPLEELRK